MLKVKTLQDRFGIWVLSLAAAVALAVTSWNVNTCCWFILGQEKLPVNAKKLRRF
ncbi:MAG: cyclic lactone autoinducer peptide [Lachnospiraceae bacterium]|nr:cyclic lactone autoinducer peptide [Lachnospiraceae bacterium]